ncbi:hypothetical protein [Deinococcus sp. QL22]|uniref:hypothetical protein n=1 Tax=Deinococcus sp. QL22 TaxID=2939437 RepID=UPI002017ECA9|nr:hypothetical protein [Deinococcus sp. QL22]UQN09378.1 hypothetical protein M1R55_22730 [Deinococcus sp. QL22]
MREPRRVRPVHLLVGALILLNLQQASAHNWWFWHWDQSTLGVGLWNDLAETDAVRAEWDSRTDLSLPRRSEHTDISMFGGNFGDTGWWGLATIEGWGLDWPWHCPTIGGCRITHGHARFNSFYGGTTGTGSGSDKRGVYCQEIGHLFGIDHSNTGDCMGKTYFNTANLSGPHNWADINNRY